MLPSSSSGLSAHSNLSQRPTSALSHRPPSSASHRPLSSASHRPPSSLSSRPLSSASARPISRVSQRPHSRHARSRLLPFCQALVSQVTGLKEEDDDGAFQTAVEYALKNLESTTMTKAAAGVDMGVIDRQVHGHAEKARINSRDTLAEALQTSYRRLKHQAGQEKDLDQEIKMSRLPDHLQFLMTLSATATPVTLAYAEAYLEGIKNPPPPPPGLTWADIFGDDPLEAESSGSSSASLSPLNSDDLELDDDEDDSFSSLGPEDDDVPDVPMSAATKDLPSRPPHTYAHRKEFEQLQARQYWRDDYVWCGDNKGKARAFDLGDASTLGPALQNVLAQERGSLGAVGMQRERYLDEQDAVREILMALQGRKNIMLTLIDGSFKETHSTPKLIHLSLTSQSSLISTLAHTATVAQQLRGFVGFVFSSSSLQWAQSRSAQSRTPRMTRTLEAFADAVDAELRLLDKWCAAREEAICRLRAGGAPAGTKLVVSLLSTQKALQDAFEDGLEVLLDVVQVISTYEYRRFALLPRTPAALSALLLDTLFEKVQVHRERGDGRVTADMLMRVFVVCAEPVWEMVGRWLKVGMGLGSGMGVGQGEDLDDEFFIEGSGLAVGLPGLGLGVGLLDPEFWAEGYVLRDGVVRDDDDGDEYSGRNARAIPSFLEHVAIPVLASGKAVGLLRALGVPPATDGPTSLRHWRSFGVLLASGATPDESAITQQLSSSVSVDTLSRLVYEELAPHCEATGALLGRILVDECDLLRHLSSVEDLFLMRRGDAMSNFTDVLFAKMDSQQPWGDFHFLNTAFRDVVEAGASTGAKEWVQPSLIRLSYRGSKDGGKGVSRTVKAINGLLVEYALPFPIAYIFSPRILQVYGEVFVFLLQIRRAKSILERILVRGGAGRDGKLGNEMKVFYAIRSRLSWFINTILNFLTTHVIHTQVLKFHETFNKAKSLDEMILVHDEHIERILGRCLLQANTSALHRAIISVLDMSLHFCELFVTFAGDTTVTHDVSRQSIIISKRHRSRRQRSQRKNVVSFSQVAKESGESSDDDDNGEVELDDEGDTVPEPSFSMAASSISSFEDGFSRIDKMSAELDGLVRFVRRGVESLAGGTGDAASSFSVLSFSLEDWDL
ncbi:Spc98 family-domain-containing protein [Mycena latifolia]|nr:Spc98 family-domain-containing protein [Mycena latifolia]